MKNPVRRAMGGVWHATRQVVLVAVEWVPGVLLNRGAAKASESVAWDPEDERRKAQPDLD